MENKPKVAATAIAGIVGALGVWAFNTWQGSDSVWLLEDPIGGMVVACRLLLRRCVDAGVDPSA